MARLVALILSLAACGLGSAAAPATQPRRLLPPAPPGVKIEQNLTYLAPHRKEKLDLYLPAERKQGTRSPAVVMIHGGGWVGGDKASDREFNIGTALASRGYVCVSINYRLDAQERWPTNLFDCKNAVRFLRANADQYGIDPQRIGVMGGSAGGHLALMVAYTSDVAELTPTGDATPYQNVSDRVNCVVNLYGITDPRTRRKTDPQGKPVGPTRTTSALLPGTTQESHAEQWRMTAPVEHVKASSPPTLTLHGKADTTVDYEQALQLDQKLAAAGVEHQLVLIDGIGHTFDLEKWRGKPLPQDLRPVVFAFFDKHLKAE